MSQISEDEKNYTIAFSAFPSIGLRKFTLLKNYFGSIERSWFAQKEDLLKTGLSERIIENFINFRQNIDISSYLLRLKKLGIEVKLLEDRTYPENLKNFNGAPIVLYTLGQMLPKDAIGLGVVGTRRITSYGKEVTESLVTSLVTSGLTIISGLAYGVDFVAHKAALESNGRTIGVWAGGLDTVRYSFREDLIGRILKNRQGAIVSEFPLGFHPSKTSFPQRNRIIAGLSLGVLVTEAAEDSGSLITAKFATQQGKKVFAVPGPITSSLSQGTARLIKEGAKLVYNVKDVLDELDIAHNAKCIDAREVLPDNKEEELVLNLLKNEEKNVDEIARELKMETSKVSGLLTLMEIKGKIKNLGGMRYAVLR